MDPAGDAERATSAAYGADSIKVLRGLDAVRKRPGMYIGDTDDGSGLHHMVYEVVDNAIDEALAGYAKLRHRDAQRRRLLHRHRRRPRHPDRHPRGGGRLGGRGHHDPAARRREIRPEFLQGLRRPARRRRLGRQRALDASSTLRIWRDGLEHVIHFAHGDAVAPLNDRRPGADRRRQAEARHRGDLHAVAAKPSPWSSSTIATIEHRLRELAFLNSGVRIVLTDARHAEIKREELHYEGGLEAFVRYLDRAKTPLIDKPILIRGERDAHRASRSRCGGTTATTRTCCPSPTTSRSATAARISSACAAR